MNNNLLLIVLYVLGVAQIAEANGFTQAKYPVGKPGLILTYSSEVKELPGSVVREFELIAGTVEEKNGVSYQWIQLIATKENNKDFSVWLLSSEYPSESINTAQEKILHYMLAYDNAGVVEYVHQIHGTPLLPATGSWEYLLPGDVNGNNPFNTREKKVKYLGHEYTLIKTEQYGVPFPPVATSVINLNPEVMIGVPHNT